MAHINGGIHALRRAIAARLPADFNASFVDNVDEVSIAYVWNGDGRHEYQETVDANSVRELLVKWQAVNWAEERKAALALSRQPQGDFFSLARAN